MLRFRSRESESGKAALQTLSRFEAANSIYRVVGGVVGTALVYPESTQTYVFYGFVFAINAVTFAAAVRGRGALTRSGLGVAMELVHSLSIIVLVGLVLPDRVYLSAAGSLPFSTYLAGTAGLLVLVPRRLRGSRLRQHMTTVGVDLALPFTLFPAFIAAAFLNGYSVREMDLGFLALQVGWTGIGIFLGYLILGLSIAFVQAASEEIRGTYESFSNWLHSEIKGDIAIIRGLTHSYDSSGLNKVVNDLEHKVGAERLRLLMSEGDLFLADILSHHIEKFRWLLEYRQIPAVGGLRLPNKEGRLVHRVLGDLLTNAANAGASTVDLGVTITSHHLAVEVSDDGPGFSDDVMSDPKNSLYLLRTTLERHHGSLIKETTSRGTTMTAVLSIGG